MCVKRCSNSYQKAPFLLTHHSYMRTLDMVYHSLKSLQYFQAEAKVLFVRFGEVLETKKVCPVFSVSSYLLLSFKINTHLILNQQRSDWESSVFL